MSQITATLASKWLSEEKEMEVAALLVSLAGVIIALMSWNESRKASYTAKASAESAQRSADAANETARIEAERRYDELTPRLRTEWSELERQGDAWGSGIRILNERTTSYAEVEAELMPPMTGVAPAAESIQSLATRHGGGTAERVPLGELPAEGSTAVVVHPVRADDGLPRGGPFRIRLRLTAVDGSSWTRIVDDRVPPTPRVY